MPGGSVAALSIGLGIEAPARSGLLRAGALFEADFTHNRYVWDGRTFTTETAFLAAIGGSKSGATRTIGPYVDPGAAELASNGNFASGTTGWTSYSSGLLSTSGGELSIDGNSHNSVGFHQGFAAVLGKVYRVSGTYRRGTSVNGTPELRPSANAGDLGGAVATTAPNGTTTPLTGSGAGAAEATTMYAGARVGGTTIIGTCVFDDLSIKEALPFRAFPDGALTAVIEAVAPASIAGNKALLQTDDGGLNLRSYLRLIYDGTGHIRLIVRFANAEAVNLDLGAVAAGAPFRVAFSAASNQFSGSLSGAPAVTDTSGSFPGVSTLRIGGSVSGEAWDGSIGSVTIFGAAKPDAEIEDLAAGSASAVVAAWGDSLTASAGASSAVTAYPTVAGVLFAPDRAVANLGIGGQTSTQIAARMGALPIACAVSGNEIPANDPVAVTSKSINILVNSGVFTGTAHGTLGGVPGTISTDGSGNWTFARTAAGVAAPCPAGTPFIPSAGASFRRRIAWLCLWRNGAQAGHSVAGDIVAAVASLGHDRYLIGAILTSAADDPAAIAAIQSLNGVLAATYGSRFVDLYDVLQDADDGSAEDLADIAAGFVPRSLRSDAIHLNDEGYAIVAETLVEATLALGW